MAEDHGCFITMEGGEGSGKSTQCRLLGDALARNGRKVVRTREPGGSPGAEEIRRLLVDGDVDRWDAMSETLLLLAARRNHVGHVIRPALQRGDWVVCDRFSDSTVAYQGYGHGLDRAMLRDLSARILDEFAPDATLILDIPVDVGLARAASRDGGEDRYERMDRAFHERLRQGFLEIARHEPDRCIVIDASADMAAVQAAIAGAIAARLPGALP
jgi:dTMP kinase